MQWFAEISEVPLTASGVTIAFMTQRCVPAVPRRNRCLSLSILPQRMA